MGTGKNKEKDMGQGQELSRCECGAIKHPEAHKCTVCKALADLDKKKAKQKAKLKRKVENPKEVEEWAKKCMEALTMELINIGSDYETQANVTRKLIGMLCMSLSSQDVDVKDSFGVHAKDSGDTVVYTMKKL